MNAVRKPNAHKPATARLGMLCLALAGPIGSLAVCISSVAATQTTSQPGSPPPSTQPISASAPAELASPGVISLRDVNRLKLYELRLDGPVEQLQVRFLRKQGQAPLEDLVRKDIEDRSDPLDDNWPAILQRGRPDEKLRLIVRETGVKYAERIEVRSNPEVINDFRRQVLPLLERGCGRCHTGPNATAFRFPTGSRQSQQYVYTLFLLLAEGETQDGPLINRSLPERSALLTYMLPPSETSRAHPPTGPEKIVPPIRSRTDPNYQAVLNWISALRVPKPQYDLEYQHPEWLKHSAWADDTLAEPEPPAIQPAASQPPPASRPTAPR